MADPGTGFALRVYLAATAVMGPLARWHLANRLKKGKEDPDRVSEKRGIPSVPRPDGQIVWLHAVGVGEVLALPGLALALRNERPDVSVLITSSSRTSAEAVAPNLPEGVVHQFLPLDVATWRHRFLDYWRPSLSVWAERDVWPGLIAETFKRGIPLALINGRVDAKSFRAKSRLRGLFRDIYRRFALIEVQDDASARHLAALGYPPSKIAVTGSLKTASPPLADQPDIRATIETALAGRRVWLAASTHEGEEAAIAEAHKLLQAEDRHACLVVAPREPNRASDVTAVLSHEGLKTNVLDASNIPTEPADAYVVGRIGQLGLWYRVADTAFVGGSLVPVGGHNPWEPAKLNCAVLHGPNTDNFASDYAELDEALGARLVRNPTGIVAGLCDPAAKLMPARAASVAERYADLPQKMARRLIELMDAG